jgi:hypothetical protein
MPGAPALRLDGPNGDHQTRDGGSGLSDWEAAVISRNKNGLIGQPRCRTSPRSRVKRQMETRERLTIRAKGFDQ